MEELWEPFGEMRRLRRAMKGCQSMGGLEELEGFKEPLTDVMDEGAELVALMELPGASKEGIKVSTTANTLKVRVEKEEDKEEKDENYLYRERRYGGFYRAISLPAEVIPDQVKASYKNGVLEVRMKKKVRTDTGKEIKVE